MLRKILFLSFVIIFNSACNSEKTEEVKKENEVLVEIKNGKYTEWYPGKKQIKFEGMVDQKGKRDGKWSFYSEKGTELSFTFYENGIKEGFTVVKYPSGVIRYRGEYLNDTIVGIWTTYDPKGKVISEKDYGYPNK
ncbi:MAG: toxin-antitoxin system YwqK family antitoxin [Crocinitomicaceae bacterium]